jgi:hypothetical protein
MSDIPFWFNDLHVLYRDNAFVSCVPLNSMSYVEKLNAIARFAIYATIIMLVFLDLDDVNQDYLFYVPIILLAGTVLLYHLSAKDKPVSSDIMPLTATSMPKQSAQKPASILSKKTRQPTYDNPFMNLQPTDFDRIERIVANNDVEAYQQESDYTNASWDPEEAASYHSANSYCSVEGCDDAAMEGNGMDVEYRKGLFRNVSDVYASESNDRSFYTVPVTSIPNDQTAFAQFCYGTPDTCKSEQKGCLRYEDQRYRRREPRTDYVI